MFIYRWSGVGCGETPGPILGIYAINPKYETRTLLNGPSLVTLLLLLSGYDLAES